MTTMSLGRLSPSRPVGLHPAEVAGLGVVARGATAWQSSAPARCSLQRLVNVKNRDIWPVHHFRNDIVRNVETAGLLFARADAPHVKRCPHPSSVAQGDFRHA